MASESASSELYEQKFAALVKTEELEDTMLRSETRKRKREDYQFQPFSIQPYQQPSQLAMDNKPGEVQAIPHFTLARSCLSFSLLAAHAGRGLFRSSVPLHDSNSDDDTVLIVSIDEHLCVLEAYGAGIYAQSRLAPHVSLQTLESLRSPELTRATKVARLDTANVAVQDWWFAAKTTSTSVLHLQQTTHNAGSRQDQPRVDGATHVAQQREEPDDELKAAYLEALYLSKTSLAYFAKSPLARGRSSFASPQAMIDALRGMLLSVPAFEKKYKSKVAAALEKTIASEARPRKTTTRNRFKLGKNGLYGSETEHLARWWAASEGEHINKTLDEQIKVSVSSLKIRESLLQIVLILEVLSLQRAIRHEASTRADSTGDGGSGERTNAQSNEKDDGHKMKDLLDATVDRLCIWQSLTTDMAKSPDKHSIDTVRDEFKDFCTAVVIPFYSSRLSREVRSLCRKFGLPRIHSPSKVVPSKATSEHKAVVKPGEAVPRVKKPLARTNSGAGRSVPSLMRAATDTTLLDRHSRERSQSVLGPRISRPLSRANSISSGQREVDMTAISRFNAQKLNSSQAAGQGLQSENVRPSLKRSRADTVADELQQAIATLKRPNRSLAVKEYADSSDRRRFESRKPLHDVNIQSTPRKDGRFRLHSLEERDGENTKPPNIATLKSPPVERLLETPVKRGFATQAALETPSQSAPPTFESAIASTPLPAAIQSSYFDSISVPDSASKDRLCSFVSRDEHLAAKDTPQHSAQVTPLQLNGDPFCAAASSTPTQSAESIYAALGWNQQDLDELL